MPIHSAMEMHNFFVHHNTFVLAKKHSCNVTYILWDPIADSKTGTVSKDLFGKGEGLEVVRNGEVVEHW